MVWNHKRCSLKTFSINNATPQLRTVIFDSSANSKVIEHFTVALVLNLGQSKGSEPVTDRPPRPPPSTGLTLIQPDVVQWQPMTSDGRMKWREKGFTFGVSVEFHWVLLVCFCFTDRPANTFLSTGWSSVPFYSVFMDIFEVAMGREKGSDVRGINYRFSFEGRIRHWLFIPEMKLTGEWLTRIFHQAHARNKHKLAWFLCLKPINTVLTVDPVESLERNN